MLSIRENALVELSSGNFNTIVVRFLLHAHICRVQIHVLRNKIGSKIELHCCQCFCDLLRTTEIDSYFFSPADNMLMSFSEIGKKPPQFCEATFIAQEILDSGFQFDMGEMYYNWFK